LKNAKIEKKNWKINELKYNGRRKENEYKKREVS
jgi:hypothetical protein